MKMNIYSLHDVKAGYFHQPFTMQNDVLAKRNVAMALQDERQSISFEPEAFTLMQIGEFDDVTGEIQVILPKQVEKLSNLKQAKK